MRSKIFQILSPRSTSRHSPDRLTFSESLLEESIQTAESIISRWTSSDQQDSLSSSSSSYYCSLLSLFSGDNREEARRYVEAVRSLQKAISRLGDPSQGSDKLVRAQSLMRTAIKHLEKEFCRILMKFKREYADPESVSACSSRVSCLSYRRRSVSDSGSDDDSKHADYDEWRESEKGTSAGEIATADLKLIADCMISAGYAKDCVRIYKRVRRSVVDEGLKDLGVERLSFCQIQKMEWETLEKKIISWLRAAKIAVRSLFYGEKVLCDYVFSSSNSIVESCFTEIARDGAVVLFGFPESVGKCRKTPEKIFRMLDLYETISDLMPEIESIFSFDSTATIRSLLAESKSKLAEAVRLMMSDFESSIRKEPSKAAVPGGGVHPIARYVMNYLAFLSDYSSSVSEIFADSPFTIPAPFPESYFSGEDATDDVYSSPISVRVAWLVLLLLCKINGKAQLYDDVAQSYLFLANNLHYVVVKVQRSNLRPLLGEVFLAKHEARVKHYAAKYEEVAWGKVIKCLPDDPTADVPLDEAEEYFRRFNMSFQEAYTKQVSWVVPSSKLRDEIKLTLAGKLVPAYKDFYERYRPASLAVRFAPEDLGNYLSDLFFGEGEPGSALSSKSASPPPTGDRR